MAASKGLLAQLSTYQRATAFEVGETRTVDGAPVTECTVTVSGRDQLSALNLDMLGKQGRAAVVAAAAGRKDQFVIAVGPDDLPRTLIAKGSTGGRSVFTQWGTAKLVVPAASDVLSM